MTLEVWLALCLASVALAVVPGPTWAVPVIVANALRYGGPDGHGAAFSCKGWS